MRPAVVTCHRELKLFWVHFDLDPDEASRGGSDLEGALDPRRRLARGVGVTAESRSAALDLIRERFGGERGLPDVVEVREDLDPRELPEEVRTAARPVTVRGVWYPA